MRFRFPLNRTTANRRLATHLQMHFPSGRVAFLAAPSPSVASKGSEDASSLYYCSTAALAPTAVPANDLPQPLYYECDVEDGIGNHIGSIRRCRHHSRRGKRLLRCPRRLCRSKWNKPKIASNNSLLQQNFNHKRVLFVQHPLEKGRSQGVESGSFIACAEVLGNCDDATEGGIPRSSRFRWFA